MTDTDAKIAAADAEFAKELEVKAKAGDRSAIRELAHRKMASFAHERLFGSLTPDANGRTSLEPGYKGGVKQ